MARLDKGDVALLAAQLTIGLLDEYQLDRAEQAISERRRELRAIDPPYPSQLRYFQFDAYRWHAFVWPNDDVSDYKALCGRTLPGRYSRGQSIRPDPEVDHVYWGAQLCAECQKGINKRGSPNKD